MNYYEHHLGDYLRDTAHLSMLEDCAYRRLLDAYYARERALPADVRECCKLARAASKPERDAVAYVLREFFSLQDDGYHQSRADKEIARFHDKQRKAKASADARWSHTERSANAMRTHTERSANAMRTHCEGNAPRARPQTPDTSNTPPTPPARGGGRVVEFPPGFDEFWAAYPRHVAKQDAAKAFAKLRADGALLRRILTALEAAKQSRDWLKDGGAFVPYPATWLNGRRWEDEVARVSDAGTPWEGAI